MNQYDELKRFNGKVYTGMLIGASHNWIYPNGKWFETKVSPDKWKFSFESTKLRDHPAGKNTGAAEGTIYHWYILADQKAVKLDNDSYQTSMTGLKFKLGHKRPYWKKFSYDYAEQMSYRERMVQILEDTLRSFRAGAEVEKPV